MISRNERRQRAKFMDKLLMPYALIAKRTQDRDAAAAILGLIDMLRHASDVMESYDMGAPVDPKEEAFLDQAIAALESDDDGALARLRRQHDR